MNKLIKNKKGIIPIVVSLPFLILLIILVVVVLGFLIITGAFLTKNVFLLIGLFLVIIGGLGFIKGFPLQAGVTLIIIGVFVLLLPMLFKNLAGITLASILP